ncbi:MAG: efflux RND transporter periplasmic adaptor subunit [Phycisphaeraceae bacterium]
MHRSRTRFIYSLATLVVIAASLPVSTLAQSPGAPVQRYEGLVKPSRQVVMQAPLTERVAEIPVEEAQPVEAGQVLAKMDDRVQQSVVELARLRAADDTSVRVAELALEDAQIRLQRLEAAYAGDAANELEVRSARIARDQAKVKLEAARRELEQAKQQLELEQRRLSQYVVEAPFDGHVSRIRTEAGASLTNEEPIFELVALSPLEAELYLPSAEYGRMTVGRTYPLQAGSPVSGTLQARLDRIVPVIDPGSRRFRAVFVIENANAKLPAGFNVFLRQSDIAGGE